MQNWQQSAFTLVAAVAVPGVVTALGALSLESIKQQNIKSSIANLVRLSLNLFMLTSN
jgi:parvulin-like peptidyl-prolyl isomerase